MEQKRWIIQTLKLKVFEKIVKKTFYDCVTSKRRKKNEKLIQVFSSCGETCKQLIPKKNVRLVKGLHFLTSYLFPNAKTCLG